MDADSGELDSGSIRRAVIMAGGKGSRLAPYTTILPKPLLPVDGRPILEVVLRQLKHYGFGQVTLCVGYLADLIANFFGDGSRLGLRIDYCFEDSPLGTAGPLSRIEPFHEPLLVMNGDILTTLDYADLYLSHLARESVLTVASRHQEIGIPFGVVEFCDQHHMTRFEEKPHLGYWVSMGIYILSPQIRPYLPGDGPFGMDDLVALLMADRQPPSVYPFDGLWLDLARPDDYSRASEVMQAHRELLLP